MAAEFITTPRGLCMIQIGKYRYGLKTTGNKGVKKRWVCTKTSGKGCRAAICTIDGVIVKYVNEHNH